MARCAACEEIGCFCVHPPQEMVCHGRCGPSEGVCDMDPIYRYYEKTPEEVAWEHGLSVVYP